MMDSHVLRKAAWRLPALAGLAVLRFNTRGTSSLRGTSYVRDDAVFSNIRLRGIGFRFSYPTLEDGLQQVLGTLHE